MVLDDEADFVNIAMYMYNLIEYSHNYSDSSGSLQQFNRDEKATNAIVCNAKLLHLTINQVLLIT